MAIQTQSPATGKIIKTFTPHTDAQVDAAIAKADAAQHDLRDWPFDKRRQAMEKMAGILENEADELAKLITLEMGKPYLQAIGEVKKCAWVCRYYAENAEAHLEPELIETEASQSYRAFFPLGVIMSVMPWNFPFWQVFRFAAPALMAGNTALLKHASNVPQCALAMEDIFKRSGFPDGAMITLLIGGSKVERILRDDRIKAATLTGSEPAGASVASICGSEIKPTVLELGGSDAFIIMPSADIEKAVEIGCLKVGDPMASDTDIGPLVNRDSYEEITRQVEDAVKAGAKRVFGGQPIDGDGFYFQPGILEDIPVESKAYHEEIFGPVMLLFKVENIDEAIRIANESPFGLGSSVWTEDKTEQTKAITRLEAGATFGGIKKSGYGRELAEEGVRTWSNVKTVYIA